MGWVPQFTLLHGTPLQEEVLFVRTLGRLLYLGPMKLAVAEINVPGLVAGQIPQLNLSQNAVTHASCPLPKPNLRYRVQPVLAIITRRLARLAFSNPYVLQYSEHQSTLSKNPSHNPADTGVGLPSCMSAPPTSCPRTQNVPN